MLTEEYRNSSKQSEDITIQKWIDQYSEKIQVGDEKFEIEEDSISNFELQNMIDAGKVNWRLLEWMVNSELN